MKQRIMKLKDTLNKGFDWFKGLPRWKWAIVVLIVVVGLMIIPNNSAPMVPGMEQIKIEKAKKRTIKQTVIANGRLEATNKQEFFAPVDSTLMELNVKVGDKVKKDQVLGRLDTAELSRRYEESRAKLAGIEASLARARAADGQLSLKSAQTRYEQQKNRLSRLQVLFKEGVATMAEVEAGRSDFAQAEADYQQAKVKAEHNADAKEVSSWEAQLNLARQEVALNQERFSMGTFLATADGVVLMVGAEKGSRVISGTRIVTVGGMDQLEVTASVNEVDAGSIGVGQSVKVSSIALPGSQFRGKVSRVAAAAIAQPGGQGELVKVPVTVTLTGDTAGLKPGFTVDLNITTRVSKDVVAIPFNAIIEKGGHKLVYAVDKGVVKEKRVTTKPGNELFDIIASGVKVGEEYIVNPPPGIKNGLIVPGRK